MTSRLTCELEDNIAVLTMDDGKANALNPDMINELSEALDHAESEAGAVILTGRQGVLSAGFDLKVMREGPDAAAAMVEAGAQLMLKIYLHPLPIIAACTGHAIAAGAILLLASDVRIGTSGAFSIGLNETSIGMTLPPFGVELARDRLTPQALTTAALGATLYDPDAACEVGYLDRAVTPGDLAGEARRTAVHYASLDGPAFAGTKINLRQATIDRIRPTLHNS